MIQKKTVPPESSGMRVDRFLAACLDGFSRSRIKLLLIEGSITCGGVKLAPDYIVHTGEEYTVVVPESRPVQLEAEDIPIDVIYEDSDIIVLNKAAGIVVHPAAGHWSGTLVNALLSHCASLPVIGGEERPGIVHRLDKDTSGLLVVALNDRAMYGMQRLFKEGGVQKVYVAIVRGVPRAKGRIESEIGRSKRDRKKMASVENGGRHAITEYRLVEAFGDYSLLEIGIQTGRTHQIRVHMSEAGHPVAGDRQYGGRRAGTIVPVVRADFHPQRQMLHAWKLRFRHPVSGIRMDMEAPFPKDFEEAVIILRNG